ncbi:Protein MAIN-LIKE 2 [Linum perenne]
MDGLSDQEDAIVESREAVMVSHLGNSTPTRRLAHFLKPTNLSSSSSSSSSAVKSQLLKHPLLFPSSAPLFCKGRNWPLRATFMTWPKLPNPNWKSWVQHLSPSHQSVWREAGIYEAIMGSTHTFREDNRLIMAMAEKWSPETNTFVFPWGEATITLEDVLILGGFSVSGHPFFACASDGPTETKQIEEKLKRASVRIRSRTSDEEFQDEWIGNFMFSGSEMEHQAFLSLWLDRHVLNDSQGNMKPSVFGIAAHLARGKPVALAPPVLASIYRDLSLLKATIVSASKMETSEPGDDVLAVNLWSSLHFVQLWAWERFPKLHPVPNFIQYGDPRSAVWDNLRSRRVRDVSLALDSAGDTFSWRPYVVSVNGWKCPDLYREKEEWSDMGSNDNLLSYVLCLRISELVGQGCIELYLPHRVAMQFGIDQDLPDIVAPSNDCPEVVWLNYVRPFGDAKIYIPPRLFESDVTIEYLNWWREPMFSSEGLLKLMPSGVARRRRTASKRKRLVCLYSLQEGEANDITLDTPNVAADQVIPSGHLAISRQVNVENNDDDDPIELAGKKVVLENEASLPGFTTKLGEVKVETNCSCFDNVLLPCVSHAKVCNAIVSREDLVITTPVKHVSVITSLGRTTPSDDSMETKPVIPLEQSNNIHKIGVESSGDKRKVIPELSLVDRISELERVIAELKAIRTNIKVEKD